jgi:hypothetical protein
MEKKYPIGGYAPGNYHCLCATCELWFDGDKRATQCETCALAAKKRFDALDPNEQELLIKRNARIANFMFSGPLTPERDLIYRIVEQWGNAVEMPNMERWLKEYVAKQATPQGIGWVKASERLPVKDVDVEAFAKFLDDQRNSCTSDMWAEKVIWDKPTAFQEWLKYFKQQK